MRCKTKVCFVMVMVALAGLLWSLPAYTYDGKFLWPYELEIERPQIMVTDGAGGVFLVWRTSGWPYEIRVQRIDHEGFVPWESNSIVASDAAAASYPAATEDNWGGVIVTWAAGNNLYAQRLDRDGNKFWNSGNGVLVLTDFSSMPETPIITPDGAGGAYIGHYRKINHVSGSGIVSNTAGYQYVSGWSRFSMVYDGQAYFDSFFRLQPGGVYLAWYDINTHKIHAQHVQNVQAGPQWGDTSPAMEGVIVALEPSSFYQSDRRYVRVARASDNALILAWPRFEGYPDSGVAQIRAQRLTGPSGTAQWGFGGVVLVNSQTAGGDPLHWWTWLKKPVIASDGAGGAFFAWEDFRNMVENHIDVYCQRVNAAGTVQWTINGKRVTFPNVSDPYISEIFPAIVSDRSGGIVTAVQASARIFVNRMDANGVTMWVRWPFLSPYSGDQREARIVFDGQGPVPHGAVVAWQESGGYFVHDSAQKIEVSNTPPANDLIANASTMFLNCWNNQCGAGGSLYWATNDGSASCGTAGQPDVWFTFTAPADGVLNVNTCGTHDLLGVDDGVDTVLSLHSGMPGTTANQFDCNDDAPAGACTGLDTGVLRDSALTRSLNAGQTVYVRVSRYSAATTGMYKLNWSYTSLLSGDLDGDGDVDGQDLQGLGAAFGMPCVGCAADINQDGVVNAQDLAMLAMSFGKVGNS